MTSQHSQRTQHGPSVASIIIGTMFTLAAVVVAWWVVTGDGLDGRHLIGYLGWMALACLLAGQTIGRAAEWSAAAERRREAAQALRAERAKHTGTWTGDGPGMVLTVRYDPAEGYHWVAGWLGEGRIIADEVIWTGRIEHLAGVIRELEDSGELRPVDEGRTRKMRLHLGLGAWPLPSFAELEKELA